MRKRRYQTGIMVSLAIIFAVMGMSGMPVRAAEAVLTGREAEVQAGVNKLDEGLRARFEQMSDTDCIIAEIALEGISQVDVMKRLEQQGIRGVEDPGYGDAYYKICKEMCTERTQDFYLDHLDTDGNTEVLYQGEITTHLVVYATKARLLELAEDGRVKNLFLCGINPAKMKNYVPDGEGGYLDPRIRADYVKLFREQEEPGRTIYLSEFDAEIRKYYGNYQGYEVVLIYPYGQPSVDLCGTEEIAGQTFTFPSQTDTEHFYAWKGGELILVRDAYASGLLSEADIRKLWQVTDDSHKMSGALERRLDMMQGDESVRVWISLNGGPTDQELARLVTEEFGDITDAQEYRKARMEISQREHTKITQAFASELLEKDGECEILYKGSYSTTVMALVKKDVVLRILGDERIGDVSLDGMDPAQVEDVILMPDGKYLDPYIRADYVRFLQEQGSCDMTRQALAELDMIIQGYYGNYGGYEAVSMAYYGEQDAEVLTKLEVAGYTFEFPGLSGPDRFFVWKDGSFILVRDAYEMGLLTDRDIRELYYAYNGGWENPFSDVEDAAWYYDSVRYASEQGLMVGRGDNRFDPEGTMTRAMAVTVLWRQAGEPEAGQKAGFRDVEADSWYSRAVDWAAAEGIVEGIGDSRFAPEARVTREQLAAILYRYAGGDEEIASWQTTGADSISLKTAYVDGENVSPWAEKAMQWASNRGILNGSVGDGGRILDPAGSATRAQVAAVMMRYAEVVE